jgi:hypothetical protein
MGSHSSKPHLWLLHVQLLLRRAGFGLMQATVLQRLEGFCGSCYQLQLLAGNVQASWQQQAVVWVKAIAALAAAAGPVAAADQASSISSSSEADALSAADCVLDVALRLIRCLCDAGAQELFVAWCEQLLIAAAAAAEGTQQQQQQCSFPALKAVKEAVAAANTSVVALLQELDRMATQQQQQQQQGSQAAYQQGSAVANAAAGAAGSAAAATQMTAAASAVAHYILAASELGKLAVDGLLAVAAQHPRHAAVLWLSLAHAAVCGCLPAAVEARLHHQQQLFVLNAAELGMRAGSAAAAGQGCELAGRLLQAAADSCILQQQQQQQQPAAAGDQQQQQQRRLQEDRAVAAQAVLGSYLSLQPCWQQLGLVESPKELPYELTELQQVVAAAPDAGKDSDGVQTALRQCVAAVHIERAAACRDLSAAAYVAEALRSTSARVAWLLSSADRQQQSLLSTFHSMLLQQHSWAAHAAAAAGATAQQQKLSVLQFLLGSAASGLLLAELQQPQAATAAAAAAAAAALTGVDALQHLPKRQPQDPARVREAFQSLLYAAYSPSAAAAATGAQQLSPLVLQQGQQPAPVLLLQRCLAFINWCSYEVCLRQWGRARLCLVAAVNEAVQWQQPTLITLLQRQALSLLAAMAKAEAAAARSACEQQQQQQQSAAGLEDTDVVMAEAADVDAAVISSIAVQLPQGRTAAAVSSLLQVLRTALTPRQQQQQQQGSAPGTGSSHSSSSRSLSALQYPQLQFSREQVVQRLQPAALQPHSGLLDAGLDIVMAGLGRKQVRAVIKL